MSKKILSLQRTSEDRGQKRKVKRKKAWNVTKITLATLVAAFFAILVSPSDFLNLNI